MTGVLDPQKIEQVLDNNIIGRLGYRNGNKMYIIPVSYLYYGGKYIIVHSREGEKIDILRQYPDVCFEVDEIDNIDNYRGVLLWGEYEELTDSRERYYALDMLLRKILKQKLNEPANRDIPLTVMEGQVLPEKTKEIVYRIRITEKTGRFERSDNKNDI